MSTISNQSANNSSALKQHPSTARRILSWTMRAILGFVVILTALVLGGITYESVMAAGDAERYPAPGQFIEVNGRMMHINCIGEGSPTVVFEAGFGAWSEVWYAVQPEVGTFTRACSYDRAGYGWSAPSNEARTQEQIAIDLHDLLAAANIQPPYILVGHSMAGKSIRLFTTLYAEDVAGLVFVDARHESQEPPQGTPEENEAARIAYESSFGLHRILRQIGVARLFGVPLARSMNPVLEAYPDDAVNRVVLFDVRETTLQTMMDESAESLVNDEQLSASQLPDNLPVFVLTADSSLLLWQTWEIGQASLAALSSNSRWLTVNDSGHDIQTDQPQAVIDAIGAVMQSANTGEPLE